MEDPKEQKRLEDEMMIAWRKLDPEAPVFMVPWSEYYDDPASTIINPSLRLGVRDASEEARSAEKEESEIRDLIIEFIDENGLAGREAVGASKTIHAVWSAFAGYDLTFSFSSQALPNDPDIRRLHGLFVLPDLMQQAKGGENREKLARKVFPAEILAIIDQYGFTQREVSTNEMAAHELFHPVGVKDKGESALGKTREHFEEAKSTVGGMLVQAQVGGIEFKRGALATLIHSAARYLSLDGKPAHQGYANITRIALTGAEKLGIITYDTDSGFQLDLADKNKIDLFWLHIFRYIKWCADAYKVEVFNHYGEPEYEEEINAERKRIQGELDQWTGKTQVAGEERVYDRVINEIKRRLQESK